MTINDYFVILLNIISVGTLEIKMVTMILDCRQILPAFIHGIEVEEERMPVVRMPIFPGCFSETGAMVWWCYSVNNG